MPACFSSCRFFRIIPATGLLLLQSASAVGDCRADESFRSFPSFADFLFAEEDYYRAEGEYRRFLFHSPNSKQAPIAALKLGFCLLRRDEYSSAVDHFQSYRQTFLQNQIISEEAAYQEKYASFRSLATGCVEGESGLGLEAHADPQVRLSTRYLRHWCDMKRESWAHAERGFALLKGDEIVSQSQVEALEFLQQHSARGRHLPQKNTVLTGLMSAILPGSGRAHVDGIREGLYSMIVVGVTGGLALRFAQTGHEKATVGWGVPAVGFYLGEIYGSVLRAVKYNRTRGNRHYLEAHSISTEKGWLPSPYLYRETFELVHESASP